MDKLMWLLSETFSPQKTRERASYLSEYMKNSIDKNIILEFGPRLVFTTAWGSNCISAH